MATIKTANPADMSGVTPMLPKLGRFAILVVTPFLLLLTVSVTAANVLREKTPDAALKLAASDAGALAKRNDFNLLKDEKSGQWKVSTVDAWTSLTLEGLNPRAVRQLAFVAENKGEAAKARRLMEMAGKMSRRDIGTQLWLANHRAGQNDIKGALTHIDIGLKTVPESGALLFPLLATALGEDGFQNYFATYIAASPAWISSFVDYALTNRIKLDVLSRSIVAAGGLRRSKDSDRLNLLILNHLAAAGLQEDVRRYYLSLDKADSRLLRDIALTTASLDPANGPLAWTATQNVEVDAAFVQANDGKAYQVDIRIGAGKRRVAAQKLLFLAEGSYRFGAAHNVADNGDGAVNWQWSCVNGSQETPVASHIFRAPAAADDGQQGPAVLTIPKNCAAQLLKLTAIGGTGSDDSMITINQFRLSKL